MTQSPDRRKLANAIRFLSADAVQQANSGHPGAPMGMADIAQVLWCEHLRHNPKNPNWHDRDRFVLSNGHGSMLIYSLLHLTGYDVSIDDIKNFRQMGSKTPGHPEYGYTPGVETTTGPLGQGIANAVGFAIAERTLAAQFNADNSKIVDHYTYAFAGDGCLMEGISHEVCSLAGTLGLGKLVVFYDDNGISIDGQVSRWFSDDTPKRFEAYGWQVIDGVDGHDHDAINQAIIDAKADTKRPTIICCKTVIGSGSPSKAGKESSHGAPLGDDDIQQMRDNLAWPHAAFEVPEDVYKAWSKVDCGAEAENNWQDKFNAYQSAHPEKAAEFIRRMDGTLPSNWSKDSAKAVADLGALTDKVATRKASQMALDALAPLLPEMIGGSADLTGSNLTFHKNSQGIDADQANGNYLYYGVREFGMFAINNGIRLHGGFIPYGGTFLIFSEYARNALRMAALMKVQSIAVLTHDSIGLGEDGPTHQPVEQIATLRCMPNMSVWRPADIEETAVAWKYAIDRNNGPTCLCLSRQGVPALAKNAEQQANIAKGAYVLSDMSNNTEDKDVIMLMATGTEVSLAMEAQTALTAQGIASRVVSFPSQDAFNNQDDSYKQSVLPKAMTKRIAIEAGIADSWYRYVGDNGKIIGVNTFGESAPAEELYKHFGLTVDNIVNTVKSLG